MLQPDREDVTTHRLTRPDTDETGIGTGLLESALPRQHLRLGTRTHQPLPAEREILLAWKAVELSRGMTVLCLTVSWLSVCKGP
jgi:hypothetical protein